MLLPNPLPTDWFGLDVADPMPEPPPPGPHASAARDREACLHSALEFYANWGE